MRDQIQQFIESRRFQTTLITLIILNAVILGLETSRTLMRHYGVMLESLDHVILYIFVLEIGLRLYVYRLRFFTRPWSVFDFIVVGIGLAPATETFSVLRALRVLRILRLVSTVKSMRRVVESLLSSIPGLASVVVVLLLFYYVFAVVGTHLFRDDFPMWFGTLGKTMFSLFQIMTLESWSMGIVRPIMTVHPHAWIFFVLFILIATFMMLNLFIAIIVNSMSELSEESAEESRDQLKSDLIDKMDCILDRVDSVEARLKDKIDSHN